jgi:hypothetical protein
VSVGIALQVLGDGAPTTSDDVTIMTIILIGNFLKEIPRVG